MEFMTGVKEKETLELSELLEEGRLGEEVKVNVWSSVYTKKALQNLT